MQLDFTPFTVAVGGAVPVRVSKREFHGAEAFRG